MELLNVLRDTNCTERHVVKDLLVMLAPFAPHFAEECWERLGEPYLDLRRAAGRSGTNALTVEDTMEIPVQVNGKTRSKVRVARGADEEAVVKAALGDATVARLTEGKEVRKRIYVSGRLLNIVVG